ncbi:MAG: hypothetical protein RL375_4400, partial [Pseudomonadota bacterium]
LVTSPGADALPALRAIAQAATRDCPAALSLSADGTRLQARLLGLAVDLATGDLAALASAQADDLALTRPQANDHTSSDVISDSTRHRSAEDGAAPNAADAQADVQTDAQADVHAVLTRLAPEWRAAALTCLALLEDFALVDAASVSLPWMAVCLPSHWDPREKAGLGFAAVHAPVADSDNVRAAAAHLLALVSGEQIWERFVWTLTTWPGLDQHPERHLKRPWPGDGEANPADLLDLATLRTERQGFIPLPGRRQAVFTIEVQARPLRQALAQEGVAPAALSAALASMSDAVLAYRSLTTARDRLCAGLDALAAASPHPGTPGAPSA